MLPRGSSWARRRWEARKRVGLAPGPAHWAAWTQCARRKIKQSVLGAVVTCRLSGLSHPLSCWRTRGCEWVTSGVLRGLDRGGR